MTAKAKKREPKPKKAAKPKDYASPQALARYDFETQKNVTAMEHGISESKADFINLRERAASAKKRYEGELEELRSYIRDREENRGKPPKPNLFQKAEDKAKDEAMKAENAKLAEGGTTSDEWPPADLWRQFPIDRLKEYGLTEKDVERIEAGDVKKGNGIGPIKTMGDLSKFTEAIPGTAYNRGYADLKGIGQAGVDRIHNAETAFWSAWKNGVGAKFAMEKGLKKPEPKPAAKKSKKGPADGDETAAGNGSQSPANGGAAQPGTDGERKAEQVSQ